MTGEADPQTKPPTTETGTISGADPAREEREALAAVEKIRALLPGLRRAVSAAVTEANAAAPDWVKLKLLLDDQGGTPGSAAELLPADAATILGTHADFLGQALNTADRWWSTAQQSVDDSNRPRVVSDAQQIQDALDSALQHALFLTFLNDVRDSRIGEAHGIVDYCQDWGLTSDQVSMLWRWLTTDPHRFSGSDLQIAFDTVNQRAYRQAQGTSELWWRAAAPLWGFVAVFVTTAVFFELLHAAGITTWPGKWVWKMLVLILMVTTGSVIHLGSRALNINYDDPMKIIDAGNIVRWLSLRWVSIIYMYLPIAGVVIALWGAHNVPSSFQKLGTAILAGYGADSFLRAAVSKLQTQSSATNSKSSASPTTTAKA